MSRFRFRNSRRQARAIPPRRPLWLEALEQRHLLTSIGPGFDLFESQPGTEVDLSSLGLGTVPLEGVPLDPSSLGNTDTIVERQAGADPFIPPAIRRRCRSNLSRCIW